MESPGARRPIIPRAESEGDADPHLSSPQESKKWGKSIMKDSRQRVAAMRWMLGLSCFLCSSVVAHASSGPYGHLYQPAYSLDAQPRLPAEVYSPQPGDLLLGNNPNCLWSAAFFIAGTDAPSHCALVIALPDGSPGVLEAGTSDRAVVSVSPLPCWFRHYKGKVWVKRRKTPLGEAESKRLTEFALLNDGKRYAILRLLGQLTPFRARGHFRTTYLGKPHGIRRRYYCTEIVLEALVHAGLLDCETTRPTATYPRDIFFDRSNVPHIDRHLGLLCGWHVPAFWTPCPCTGR